MQRMLSALFLHCTVKLCWFLYRRACVGILSLGSGLRVDGRKQSRSGLSALGSGLVLCVLSVASCWDSCFPCIHAAPSAYVKHICCIVGMKLCFHMILAADASGYSVMLLVDALSCTVNIPAMAMMCLVLPRRYIYCSTPATGCVAGGSTAEISCSGMRHK